MTIPPLVALYGAMPGRASWLCTDPMLMILPLPRWTMPRATRWLTRNALVKLVATRSFQSCSVNSVNGARRWMPALLTRMSGVPHSCSMSAIPRSTAS